MLTLEFGHDYQVPVDKHDSDQNFTPHHRLLGGVKGQIFSNNSVSRQHFLLQFRMQTEVQHV